ncbi:MAG: hypothetical protein ACJAXI_002187 [Crocinitomicaceae bacterium]|jgi:hypothetical protein
MTFKVKSNKKRLTNMKYLFILIGLSSLFACSEPLGYDNSKVDEYLSTIDSLNQKGYVPHYRGLKKYNLKHAQPEQNTAPLGLSKMTIDDSVFLVDSVFYAESRKSFFNQDRDFLHWLLSFKSDTTRSTLNIRAELWSPYINPLRSVSLPRMDSKSLQALHLIYYLLDEEKVYYYDSRGYNQLDMKYENIESFLTKYPNSNMNELRKLWGIKQNPFRTVTK